MCGRCTDWFIHAKLPQILNLYVNINRLTLVLFDVSLLLIIINDEAMGIDEDDES